MNRPENTNVASLMELAQSDFQKEDGDTDDEKGNHVWDQKGTTAIIGGKLREPPNVAESGGNGGCSWGEQVSEHIYVR